MATLNRTFSVKNGLDVANTVVIDANRNLTNIANLNLSGNIIAGTLNVVNQANSAFDRANLAYGAANTANTNALNAYGQANAAYGAANTANTNALNAYAQANAAYGQANTARTTANDAYLQANTARDTANNAYAQANGATTTSGNAYTQANAAYGQANTARDTANGAYAQANGAYAQANGAYSQANGAFAQANGAYAQANGAYSQANNAANTVRVSQNSAGTLSSKQLNFVNSASVLVSVSDSGDGNANIVLAVSGAAAGDAYNQANAAYSQANDAFSKANAAYDTANLKAQNLTALGAIQIGSGQTNNVWSYSINVNTASTSVVGVTKLVDVVNSSDTANAATANAVKTAWDYANTKLSLNGGTLGGSLNISGNLTVTGNTNYINVSTYTVSDPLIYLAANNDTSDVVDIGFLGGKNTAGTYSHTGLARHAADGTWYLFDNLVEEGHQNNIVDVANTTYALLKANLYAQRLNVVGGFANVSAPLTVTGNTTLTANLSVGQNVNVGGSLTANTLNVATSLIVNGVTVLANTNVTSLTVTGTGSINVALANVSSTLSVGSLAITTNVVTTSSSGQVILDAFPSTAFASAKYFVQANSGTNYVTTEMVLVQDGTNIWLTEYGTVQTANALGTFSADIDTGNVQLLFTATNNVNTIRSIRYGVLPP